MSFNEWKEVKLGDSAIEIIDGDRGKNYPKGSDFINKGHCLFLNTKNVTMNGFLFTEKMFISKDKDELLRKGKLKRKDIVLTTRGTVGNVAFYNNEIKYENVRINSGMVILRSLETEIFPSYMYWLFRSPILQNQILSLRTGSAQPQLPISVMKNLKFLLPPLPEQKAIASTISCLDDKIVVNNNIKNALEKMAQAVFKSWFLDFEFPNEDGQPYKSCSGEMVDSEFGMIPLGWRVVELGKVTTNIRNKTKSNDFRVLSAVNTGNLMLSEEYFTKQVFSKDLSKYLIVKEKEFAYNPARVNIGSIGMNEYDFDGCVSPVYVVFKTEKDYQWFFKVFIKTDNFKSEVLKRASGSVRQAMNYNDFALIKTIYPTKSIIDKFNQFFEACYFYQKELTKETEILSNIRNKLLPKIMSGEIRVPVEVVM
jgi:type I restriction enzyme S subunit